MKCLKFLMTAALAVLLAIPAALPVSAAAIPAQSQITVTQTADPMRWAVDKKLIPENVAESDSATHALVAEALYRLGGSPHVTGCHFSDLRVGTDGWDAARWAVDVGAFYMYDNGAFAPANTLTRLELARVLHRYALGIGCETGAYRTCVSWALDTGALTFDADGAIHTEATATVQDFARAFSNFCAYYNK